jgi:hypothetical protein
MKDDGWICGVAGSFLPSPLVGEGGEIEWNEIEPGEG